VTPTSRARGPVAQPVLYVRGPVERVTVQIGPARADLALEWTANGKRLVDGMRAHPEIIGPEVTDHALDLCETLLETWAAAASQGKTFEWRYDAPVEVLVMIADVWIRVGALDADALAAMNVTWAHSRTRPFSDLVTASIADALQRAGLEGQALLDRLAAIQR
jgi:hypothetical protein